MTSLLEKRVFSVSISPTYSAQCFEMESGKHAGNTDLFKSLLKYQHRLGRQQCSNSNSNKRVVESHWKQMSSAHNSGNVW